MTAESERLMEDLRAAWRAVGTGVGDGNALMAHVHRLEHELSKLGVNQIVLADCRKARADQADNISLKGIGRDQRADAKRRAAHD